MLSCARAKGNVEKAAMVTWFPEALGLLGALAGKQVESSDSCSCTSAVLRQVGLVPPLRFQRRAEKCGYWATATSVLISAVSGM